MLYTVLLITGLTGFILHRGRVIFMLVCLEMMLLGATLLILASSSLFDDIAGQAYAVYIISVAGAESAIGLGLIVARGRAL
jgi:NADH-ubiquinone oxidoreductase chain 4L